MRYLIAAVFGFLGGIAGGFIARLERVTLNIAVDKDWLQLCVVVAVLVFMYFLVTRSEGDK